VYFRTCGGRDLYQDTYFVVHSEDGTDHFYRFVEIQDSAGGLGAVLQDEYGFLTYNTNVFDEGVLELLTDPQDIALAMLAIHG
jgi:hypothetical protein